MTLVEQLLSDANGDNKRLHAWVAAQGGAAGLSADAQALLDKAQKSTAAVEANLPAIVADGGSTAADAVSLAAAVSTQNLPAAIAAFVRLLSDAGADVLLIKKVIAAA